MSTVLGLATMVVFFAAVISLAAGVTWMVVKLSPAKDKAGTQDAKS